MKNIRLNMNELQEIAAAAFESNDLEIWVEAAAQIYRHCGGRVDPGWDEAVLWDDCRPWSGWHTYTETELREYVAGLDK